MTCLLGEALDRRIPMEPEAHTLASNTKRILRGIVQVQLRRGAQLRITPPLREGGTQVQL